MEDDFAGKEDTPTTASEVDEINATNMAGNLHTIDTGHPDPDCKTSEPHSEEAKETRDHLHSDTTTPGTITPQ